MIKPFSLEDRFSINLYYRVHEKISTKLGKSHIGILELPVEVNYKITTKLKPVYRKFDTIKAMLGGSL